jgi:hypothetical protein
MSVTTKKISDVFSNRSRDESYKAQVRQHTIDGDHRQLSSNILSFPMTNVFSYEQNQDRFIEARSGYISNLKFRVSVTQDTGDVFLECPLSIIKSLSIDSPMGNLEVLNYGEILTKSLQVYQDKDKFKKMFGDCGLSPDLKTRR